MTEQAAPTPRTGRDRGDLIGVGGMWLAKWSLILVSVAAGAWVLGWLISALWVVILPALLAIIVATVLWPPTKWMLRVGFPAALAATLSLVVFFLVIGGIITLIVPSVVDSAPELVDKASAGVSQVQDWLKGPPVNLQDEQIDNAVSAITSRLQESGSAIASGVFTGVSAAGSILVTLALVLVLTFFFVKDGVKFIPWLHGFAGGRAGRHLAEILARMWATLGGFIRTQAIVSLIDAFFIGLGLVILGVPLALVLATITFLGGFIPIVGAFVAGALAVLVALVANGPTTALIVLVIIIAVQQLEGNVLQPILQSRSMNLHPAIVLLAVTGGGSVFGIIGAFLAVPAAAVAAVLIRYVSEQIDERSVEADRSQLEDEAPDTEDLVTDEDGNNKDAKIEK
ncbi:AI-2E family transporter [Rhodococcus sp. BP-252]|uniref:AI-2E family transporter n=1 Tax=unclassified Rhodococcus (in: high G+C Gram-positive bacteria) TaxID=192944 RepID=UPI001C9A513D|nr:AI-2E family transporter [Rhodococcus sp. BP-320]MBY6417297.1 AI-2E family transporter [Rhodococcus sp. BP-321]MBY6421918.1 AI-2E family transporter [Rhodococcus sp. BP-324]MBY6427321.1 AI-2E family transporter [Rhodococcus sp. BP-323]MBY6432536.1 AI-2E family transporter [Rhodococcus sp. BP-322]MBY6441346.1 AI-2E family transporter [Rhodococcus sp. BP-319]MBY6445259.1 AI-2E family transporter [Rhodococcus sp. BP-318]MBY6450470.1 AI-2E family transporter [Rhodococcus sp. BP-315]MBY645477